MPKAEKFVPLLAGAPVRELRTTFVRRVQLLPLIQSAPVNFLYTSGKPNRFNPAGTPCVYFA